MDPFVKIATTGAGGVGKSTFTIQFCYSKFIEEYDPTIEDSYRKQVEIDNEIIDIEIFDNYYFDWGNYFKYEFYKRIHGFIVVYSITDEYSFDKLENFLNEIYKYREVEEFPIIIIGNKNDLEDRRVIKKEEGEEFAIKHGCPFYETSAKTRYNIEETIFTLLREIRKYPFDLDLNPNPNSNSNIQIPKKNNSNCFIF
ncbi:ras gtpase-related [Anaeramoeba ignava]|uniref:Ras gtpase-related n=1 Tax=Anaeramoeba ignava TaxID=1746090 RepID=A0A9Q0LNE3_ANAIG|nr:ras gtpase-related [Anaeramoeba ignava]